MTYFQVLRSCRGGETSSEDEADVAGVAERKPGMNEVTEYVSNRRAGQLW